MKPQALFLYLNLLSSLIVAPASFGEVGDPFGAFIERTDPVPLVRLEQLKALEDWWIYTAATVPFDAPIPLKNTSGMQVTSNRGEVFFSDEAARVRFVFETEGRGLKLVKALGRPATFVNFSRSRTHKVAALNWRDSKSGNLGVLYFSEARPTHDKPPKSQYAYQFPLGANWKSRVVNIKICGFRQEPLVDAVKRGISVWQKALEGRVQINVEVRDHSFAAFSDLNTSCIYWIDGYRYSASPKSGQQAGYVGIPNASRREMVDGDIFLLSSELLKGNYKTIGLLANAVEILTIHEVGHLLGLAHPRSKTEKSVMNYQDLTELTEYDLGAIQSLYP